MSYPVYYFFQLVLEILPNSTPNSVDKSVGLTQASTKEGFKFFPVNGNVSLILRLPLVLLPKKQDDIFKEDDNKWYPILTFSLGSGKMVLILQKQVIALQVSFIPIYV